MNLPPLRRHDLATLDPDVWAAELVTRPELADLHEVQAWVSLGRPLVLRRRCAGDPPGCITLGLPLPPSMGKRRLAFALPPLAVRTVVPPPPLDALAAGAPAAWHDTLRALRALARRHRLDVRVFGSFAWQYLTGLPYVTIGSDLDLLWPLTATTPAVLAALPAIEAEAPGRLDGEVVAPDGAAANWRELAGPGEVLVKTLTGVALADRAAMSRGEAAST